MGVGIPIPKIVYPIYPVSLSYFFSNIPKYFKINTPYSNINVNYPKIESRILVLLEKKRNCLV